ncbi:MAG: hypothetical protein F4Z28_07900 [Gammaproteobacteria bacterium]|nr:hypothetical protein [Gammaproteobacteria bacterium]
MRNLIVALLSLAVASTTIAEDEATSAHVYQAVVQLGAEVGLVREVMGRPELTTDPWIVVEAQPRHVFYQALTLLRKVNRLAVELTEEQRVGLLPVPEGDIQPALVLDVINRASMQIDAVRNELGITYRAEPPELEADRQPSDVLREIVQVSRQLNFLIDRKFRPEDVYGRLELAATYVAGALTDDDAAPVYGQLPPFESGKVPADVYRRVLECLELATVIGERRGVDVLKLNLRRELRRRDIAPADVYDLATTLLSEVAYLTLVLEANDVDAPPIERPRHIFPSHVYQIAGMLQDELARLEDRM